MGKLWVSVRDEYRLGTEMGARRRSVALLVDEELSLRSAYGYTPSTGDTRALYGHCTHNARTPRVFSYTGRPKSSATKLTLTKT